ncbi:MAG: energy-coupling factor ABC transporter permease [Gammaproteobacteria bacterium]
MQFFPGILDQALAWPLGLLSAVLLLSALPALGLVGREPARLHLLLGSAVGLAVLWLIRARVDPGLGLHVLGVTTVTMILGWRLALVATALAQLAVTLVSLHGAPEPAALAAGWLVSGALPATVTYGIARAARFHLPRNLFIYLFVCCFFGSAAAVTATWLAGISLLGLSGVPGPTAAGDPVMAFLPLVMFPEAFINGALLTLLAVYRPDWLRLFDEHWYLDR